MPENVKSGERIAPEEKPVRARDLGLIVEGTPGDNRDRVHGRWLREQFRGHLPGFFHG